VPAAPIRIRVVNAHVDPDSFIATMHGADRPNHAAALIVLAVHYVSQAAISGATA
jgi:hypothetical protein